MGLGDGDWFVCTVVLATLLGAHALIDAICTVATLFPNLRWSWFRSIYPSVFKHSHVRDDDLTCRLLIYAVAAMGVVRLAAAVMPFNPALMLLAAAMYVLEGLMCLYELDTACTANYAVGRTGALSALAMAVATGIYACVSYILAPQAGAQ